MKATTSAALEKAAAEYPPADVSGAMARGAATGAKAGAALVLTNPLLLALCAFPPACVGIFVLTTTVGAAAHTVAASAQAPVQAFSPDEAVRLAELFEQHASSARLCERIAGTACAPAGDAFPRLLLTVSAHVEPNPTASAVGFGLKAEVTALLTREERWEPSEHWAYLPERSASDWRDNDHEKLRRALDEAVDLLAKHIAYIYKLSAE